MADYKDRIRKLLALAESPVEAEAKAALLRARELMAKHKLTEADLEDAAKKDVRKVETDVTCSKRRDPWIILLSAIIAMNYCCQDYMRHRQSKQTQHVGFIGLSDDVEVCVAIFKYAVSCIRAGVNAVREANAGYPAWYVTQQCVSFGYGFTEGIRKALEKQDEERRDEWGLVLVMPQEVREAAQSLKKCAFRPRSVDSIDPETYAQGYEQGKEFDPAHRLGDGVAV